jgi:hypothetical protein
MRILFRLDIDNGGMVHGVLLSPALSRHE